MNYTDSVPFWDGFSLSLLDLKEFSMYILPPWGVRGGDIEVSGFKKTRRV